jgi:hypothetical protein
MAKSESRPRLQITMRNSYLISTLLAASLLASCGGGDFVSEPVAFQSLQDEMTRSIPAGTYVFKTQAEMEAAWTAAPQQFGDPKPLPVIDFSQAMVVGVSLGVGIRCNIPIITSVVRHSDDYLVSYKTNEDTGVTTLACLHQWHLTDFAAIPATRGAVVFQRVVSG